MTANNARQYQGRQQHGWFGTGTSPHDIHPTTAGPSPEPLPSPRDYPTVSADRRGWRPVPQFWLGAAPAPGEPSAPDVTLNQGMQDKHLVGTNNYKPGRSVLLADPRELLRQFAGRGKPMNKFPPGTPGYKERLDTGDRIIGIWKTHPAKLENTFDLAIAVQVASVGSNIYPREYLAWIDPMEAHRKAQRSRASPQRHLA